MRPVRMAFISSRLAHLRRHMHGNAINDQAVGAGDFDTHILVAILFHCSQEEILAVFHKIIIEGQRVLLSASMFGRGRTVAVDWIGLEERVIVRTQGRICVQSEVLPVLQAVNRDVLELPALALQKSMTDALLVGRLGVKQLKVFLSERVDLRVAFLHHRRLDHLNRMPNGQSFNF
jgi:hypothetical protein